MHLNEGRIDWMELGGGRVRSLPPGPQKENVVTGTASQVAGSALHR